MRYEDLLERNCYVQEVSTRNPIRLYARALWHLVDLTDHVIFRHKAAFICHSHFSMDDRPGRLIRFHFALERLGWKRAI